MVHSVHVGRDDKTPKDAVQPRRQPQVGMIEHCCRVEQDFENENRQWGHAKQFQAVFGTKVTRDGIAKSLAAFQRTLVTKPAPFDRYLNGEKDALSAHAKEGMRLFMGEAGCVQCHRGPLLSDGKYYRLGVGTGDKGRGAVTKKKEDNFKFRTPSLRNMAPEGPYMHDGSHKTLQDVVTFYYRGVSTSPIEGLQLDVQPLVGQSFSEIALIVAFLESLTAEAPRISVPKLP
jgi:cytochrome c peroxidase